MKKFLVSLILCLAVTVFLKDGNVIKAPWIFIAKDGVYLMTDKQAQSGTDNILEGATRIVKEKTSEAKEIQQHIKVAPKLWSHWIPKEHIKYIYRGD